MSKFFYILVGVALFAFYSCNDEEGQGGTSIVEGYIYKVVHPDDVFSLMADTFPAAKEDVYIVYGNEAIYGDKMETGYDGFFRFKYLNKGTYKVYAYSTFPNSRKVAQIDTVTVGSHSTSKIPILYIHEGKSLETSYIKGNVRVKYFNKGNAITDYKPAMGIRVFIKVKGAPYQFDEIRTGFDGVFMFQNLQPGDYEVFVLTEDPFTEALSPVLKSVTVSKKGVIESISGFFDIIVTV